MKDDKICFSKTLTYLILLVAVVFGAFWMMNYTNSTKIGSKPKAAGNPTNHIRYSFLNDDGKLVNPNWSDSAQVWNLGECEYKVRNYREGSKTLSENAYTGYISDGSNLILDKMCSPFVYGGRDLKRQRGSCDRRDIKYCKGRTTYDGGEVKLGSLFYGYDDAVETNGIYQIQAVKDNTGKYNTVSGTKKYIYKRFKTDELPNGKLDGAYPAYTAVAAAVAQAPSIRNCTYYEKAIKFMDDALSTGDYYFTAVYSGTSVNKNGVYVIKQKVASGTDRLTSITCSPLTDGIADQVSWRSNTVDATSDLNFQTCQDNAIKTSNGKTFRAVCIYQTVSGKKVSVNYEDYVKNPDGSDTTIRCLCDPSGKYTYPTLRDETI